MRNNFLSFAVGLLLLLTAPCVFSQSSVGGWLMFFNQTRVYQNWSLHTEAQYRSFELLPNTQQMLLRGGINYHLNNSSFVSFGYGHIGNYAFDKNQMPGMQISDHVLWQQFLMRNVMGNCLFEHRYRLEQRWRQSKNSAQYLDRMRYLLRVSIPLSNDAIKEDTWFLSFYNEIFLHLTAAPFDRNRLYGAVGYQFAPTANMQMGYLAQTVGITTKHYLQAALFYNVDLTQSVAQ